MVDQTSQRVGVVVVAYNAASTLMATLERIPLEFREQLAEVIVLDDASVDHTFELAKMWAQLSSSCPTLVVRHSKNVGYGGNQKAAYALAAERGLDVVVLLHGDGQYAPEFLPEMVAPILAGDADAVFGSRMLTKSAAKRGGMPLYKRVGNRLLTAVENRLLGTSLSEFHSGYRAYSLAALNDLPLQANSDDFDFDTQIIVQLVDAGKRIVEIPIPTFYGDEICYVNGLRYAADVVKDVVEYRLAKKGFGTAPWISTPHAYALKPGDGSSHSRILEKLRESNSLRILDLGCSGGLLAHLLRERGHSVVGVDVIEIDGVRDRVDEFHLGDLSSGIPDIVGNDFDMVILADVVEHLARPVDVLRQARGHIRPKGEMLLSVPNFGHWYSRFRVATGTFGYDRRGILDETHLRFFTRRTLRRLVRRAGFDIIDEEYTGLPLAVLASDAPVWVRTVRRLESTLVRLRPQLFAYQFVLRVTPHADSFSLFERKALAREGVAGAAGNTIQSA